MIGLVARARRRRDDEGAYAVLYGVAMIVLLILCAMVVDISTMRADRRTERAAADASAVAGAYSLAFGSASNPQAGCRDAVNMAEANLLSTTTPHVAPNCGNFPASVSNCTGGVITQSTTTGVPVYTITVQWPVPDTSNLMTHPDNAPHQGTQQVFSSANGTLDGDQCGRIAVTVSRTSQLFFASVINLVGAGGQGSTATTSSSSVGLGSLNNNLFEVAALNILDWHACDALQTNGQGSIKVLAVTDALGKVHPGIIAVESDGHPSGVSSSCPNSAPYVIDPQNNPNNFIDAEGPAGPYTGLIEGYALNASPVGNPPYQSNTALPLTVLGPKVSLAKLRFYTQPVTDKYGCKQAGLSTETCGSTLCPGCKPYDSNAAIPQIDAALDRNSPVAYSGAQAPYNTAAFQVLPDSTRTDALKSFVCSASTNFYIPPGNWYINCPGVNANNGFQVGSGNNIVFGGGTVVFAGKVDISGCLATNVPEFGTTATSGATVTCPTVNSATLTATPDTTTDAMVFVRAGRFYQVSNGSRIVLPRTAVVLNDTSTSPSDAGAISLSGPVAPPILWTAPEAADCGSDPCKYARLQKIMLWSESPNTQTMGGQANMLFKGVFFTPKAQFEYKGQGTQNAPFSAQFWAARLLSDGQGTLVMAPDPNDTIARPVASVSLIR